MTPRVRGVTRRSISSGSMLSVSGWTSARTGRAPTCSITFTEAAKVMGVVMTSSPGPIPSVTSAVWRPAVQELSASAPGAPRYAANWPSNRWVRGPVVIQPERSASTTSLISSSPMRGGEKGRNSARWLGEGRWQTPPACSGTVSSLAVVMDRSCSRVRAPRRLRKLRAERAERGWSQ